jgi:hypothetical protein
MQWTEDGELILLRLSGWKGRLVNVILGTPLFGIGGLMMSGGAFDATGLGMVLLLSLGGIMAFIGAVMLVRALRGSDFAIKMSSSHTDHS